MNYPEDTSNALTFQGYEVRTDFDVRIAGPNVKLEWYHTDPKPSPETVEAILASPAYLDWFAANGGDKTLTMRTFAEEYIRADDVVGMVDRAYMQAMQDDRSGQRSPRMLQDDAIIIIQNGGAD